MNYASDILEDDILYGWPDVLQTLLKDHTTKCNIIWATDMYAKDYGEAYSFFNEITVEQITGPLGKVIRPRADKSKEEQIQRVKDKAEVFTPAWICNAQNNLIDEAWFGRTEGLFNRPDPDNPQKWINNEEKIVFLDGKTWKDYVADMRLEITCGEAPYLANRYDAVTGEYNTNVKYRIGLLDRKLRIVTENAKDSKEWLVWGKVALRSTYGYEWQGDNLLLAREALFFTFAEHFIAAFGEKKFNQLKKTVMPGAAYIISWNLWQMDGLKFGIPGYEPNVEKKTEKSANQYSLLDDDNFFDGEEKKHEIQPYERFCIIKDFLHGVNLKKENLTSRDFHDQSAPTQTFESLVHTQI